MIAYIVNDVCCIKGSGEGDSKESLLRAYIKYTFNTVELGASQKTKTVSYYRDFRLE